MVFSGKMAALTRLVIVLFVISSLERTIAETYECTVGNYGSDKQQHCIFRNVRYNQNSTNIVFKAPNSDKQPRIVFEDSKMDHLPKEFLETFGKDLKVLIVSKCELRSVVITHALEELHAIDNYITKVIVHQTPQSSPLKEIHLQSNRLKDISNITKSCKNARIVDLSRNQELADQDTFDLSMFNGFNQLEYLLLADIGAFYLDNTKNAVLPALTLLDLSMNNLLPSDLRLDRLDGFEKLEVLRLNDNNMAQLDYALLTGMKSLKTVYLEGNSFDCSYLKTMVKFLNENNIVTPVARPANNCDTGFMVEHEMCCKSAQLSHIPKPSPTRPLVPAQANPAPANPAAPNTPILNEVETKPIDVVNDNTPVMSETHPDNGVTNLRVNLLFILTGAIVALVSRD
ncbi:uncharacterized protein LOC128734738 isoform X2 [Sabethes cyaneus]|uniref:uncharacterized protein LOC128734738 isoform X2 n=1 Tax=Sabethes cyaneus TaxID=53552 RepID=UPI00237D4B91|nr:uncharacterized protein LOC128734738 isoform X2 [Sabethes cyaneus]